MPRWLVPLGADLPSRESRSAQWFNPRPVRGPAASEPDPRSWAAVHTFQPSAGPRTGRISHVWRSTRSSQTSFNPRPVRGPAASRPRGDGHRTGTSFNPRPVRGPAASVPHAPPDQADLVSTLGRSEDRPHPARAGPVRHALRLVSTLGRSEDRTHPGVLGVDPATVVHVSTLGRSEDRPHLVLTDHCLVHVGVSTLGRSEDRPHPGALETCAGCGKFQPSAGPRTGRIPQPRRPARPDASFNPRPVRGPAASPAEPPAPSSESAAFQPSAGPRTGRIQLVPQPRMQLVHVSTLGRSEDRPHPPPHARSATGARGFNPRPVRGPAASSNGCSPLSWRRHVSTLGRSEDRPHHPQSRPLLARSQRRFNPRPVRGPAASPTTQRGRTQRSGFNPRPVRGPAASSRGCRSPPCHRRFNPRPVRGPAASIMGQAEQRRVNVFQPSAGPRTGRIRT